MNNQKLIASFAEFASSKDIDRPTVIRILDDVLRTILSKKYGEADNFHIVINPQKGDLQILRSRVIVANDDPAVSEPDKVSLDEAHRMEADFEVGEELSEEISIDSFTRIEISKLMQLLSQKLQELELLKSYEHYKSYEGELIYAEVYHIAPRYVLLRDDEKNDLILPRVYQIPNEMFRKGTYIHATVQEVTLDNSRLKIILSRTSALFLRKVMEKEISEVGDGIIQIRRVVRRPGERAKVIVSTEDDRVDPVGTCIGSGGDRIKSIARRELGNRLRPEQIDIIGYTEDRELFIRRVLNLTGARSIQEGEQRISVYLDPEQIPLAIGNQGQNIDLASQLVGKPIDIYREFDQREDGKDRALLKEVLPQVDPTVVEAINLIGIDTLGGLLRAEPEDVERRADLPTEVVQELYRVAQNIASNDLRGDNNHS